MADQQGDSFIQLVNANLGITRKICRLYCDNPDERDDLLQEMMFQLWRAFPAFHGHSKFSTWMYRVCLNTALTYRRNNRNTKKESISQSHHEIPDRPPEHQEESIAMLFKAIAGLSPVNKAIVLLYLENMSYDEIASITGLSRSNVSVRLVRLKKELETELKKKIKSIEDVNF